LQAHEAPLSQDRTVSTENGTAAGWTVKVDRDLSYRIIRECGATPYVVFHVLLCHADHKTYKCDPSIRRIARLACISPNTVRAGLSRLAEKGFVKIKRRHEPGKKESDCHEFTLVGVVQKLNHLDMCGGSKIEVQVVQNLSRGGSKIEPEVLSNEVLSNEVNTPPNPQGGNSDHFDEFWKAYPRHSDKKKAIRAWKKLRPSDELRQLILASIEQHKKTRQWKDGIIPHASTFLNGERWEDEVGNGALGRAKPLTREEMTKLKYNPVTGGMTCEDPA
jgi:hypothetical protein